MDAEAEDWADTGRLDALRARVAVRKAVSAATDRVATVDAPLARHLRTSIHTGLACSYEPDPTHHLDWVLD